jgi:hypothetical protein
MRPRLLLALVASLLMTGCLGTYTGDPEARGPRNIKPRTRPDLAKRVKWRQIHLGAGKRALLLGYVKTTSANYIYDANFKLVGRVSPSGQVLRIHLNGREENKGNYSLDLAVLTVFGYTERKTVVFSYMEAPRG